MILDKIKKAQPFYPRPECAHRYWLSCRSRHGLYRPGWLSDRRGSVSACRWYWNDGENERPPSAACVLTELCKFFEDDPILAGPSIGKCHNQIEVLILVAKEAFQLVLGLLPFPQNVSQCFWQPHLTDTGIGFRLFQNNSCAGVRHERSEDVVDILLTQRFNRPFGCRVSSLSM